MMRRRYSLRCAASALAGVLAFILGCEPNPYVKILAPKGGEDHPVGSDLAISWESEGVSNVRIDLSRDGGATWKTIADSLDAAPGVYSWVVERPASSDCLVRISDAAQGSPAGVSDGTFSIIQELALLSPEGAEELAAGSLWTIRWAALGVPSVQIELSRNGGSDWEVIAPSVEGPRGAYAWTVDDGGQSLPQDACRVRILDTVASGPSAASESNFAIVAWDGIFRADDDAPDAGDGLSWVRAFRHPQDAMARSSSGTEIWIAEGTYTVRRSRDEAVLVMNVGVEVYGGFAGTETSRAERDWEVHQTLLDGEGQDVNVVLGASDSLLDGLGITGGRRYCWGAGIYCPSSSVMNMSVSNCSIFGNEACFGNGGGICVGKDSSLTVTRTVISDNIASWTGGGIQCDSGGLVIVTDCVFSGNRAVLGGGFCCYEGNHVITNCVFDGNEGQQGGGIATRYGTPAFFNCTFYSNTASDSGGAFYGDNASPKMTNCILWGDAAGDGQEIGGEGSTCTVTYSCVEGGYSGQGNIGDDPVAHDPLFVDPANGDLHLSSSSPCVDTGTGTGAPDHDLDGNARPTGAACDMGAYEYQP